ncbi:MAG: FAD-binding oxidoreductase [Rhizobiaceae bacterium]
MALPTRPVRTSYDVVIAGGAIMGSSVAWFLSQNPDFDGTILVVERDPSYEWAATSHTNSCIRQQFSSEINVRISQFGVDFVRNFRSYMGNGPDIPQPTIHAFGYLYLAASDQFAENLRLNQATQAALGAGTRILSPDQIAQAWPFYNLEGILLGSHNNRDEGYFDGNTLFDWWKRESRRKGVEYVHSQVIGLKKEADRIVSVTLQDGTEIACGTFVNTTGTRGNSVARLAGLDIPIEPRKRYTFVFDAAERLDRDLPLTIDPSGIHVRTDGAYYMCGCAADDDSPVDPDDFAFDQTVWEEKAWPAVANRIPAFERVKLLNSWVGHYDYNLLDQNAIVGPHTQVRNFLFANGFSGHGLQQSPAVGRAISEWIVHGRYITLDLSPLGYERIEANRPLLERAVI